MRSRLSSFANQIYSEVYVSFFSGKGKDIGGNDFSDYLDS